MRRSEASRYDTPQKALGTAARVGAVEGTTGERFARERIADATVSLYRNSYDAVEELKQHRIDLFINDLPVVGWFVSENESELALLRTPLTDDKLAWGFRPGDDALLAAANASLARWKTDGTLSRILRRWLRVWPRPL
jgi:ABC-type amino acid transport substrate-binding protein